MLGARDQMNRLGDLGRRTYRTGRLFGAPRRAAIVYYALCAVILGWAAFQRFRLPVWPLADLDIWGYLNPALSKLTSGGFSTRGEEISRIQDSCSSFLRVSTASLRLPSCSIY